MTFCIFRFLQTVAVQNKKQLWLLRPFVAEITFPELGLNVSRFFLSVRTQETDLVSADHIYFGAQDLTETAIRYLHMTNPTDTSIPVQIRFFSDGNGSQTGINDGGLGEGGVDTPFHRNFVRLVLGCIETDFASTYSCCSTSSRSTLFAHFYSAPN